MTAGFNVHNTSNALIILKHCIMLGAANVAAADNANIFAEGLSGAGTGGLGIALTQ